VRASARHLSSDHGRCGGSLELPIRLSGVGVRKSSGSPASADVRTLSFDMHEREKPRKRRSSPKGIVSPESRNDAAQPLAAPVKSNLRAQACRGSVGTSASSRERGRASSLSRKRLRARVKAAAPGSEAKICTGPALPLTRTGARVRRGLRVRPGVHRATDRRDCQGAARRPSIEAVGPLWSARGLSRV
jgi:hypothetical protein